MRYQPLLTLGPDASVEGRAVLGRHFDRDFGTGETYYREAKARTFTWDRCCLDRDLPVT